MRIALPIVIAGGKYRLMILPTIAFLLFLGSEMLSAESFHLHIGSGIVDCGPYVEIPILFTQPENSSASTMTVEIFFPPEVFQEQFLAPNSIDNRPQIIRGDALASGVGANFSMFSLRSIDGTGASIPGRWRIIISSPAEGSPNIPAGEIVKLRLYPKANATQGTYLIIFKSTALYTIGGNLIQPISTQNGSATIFPCLLNTTTLQSSTSTTAVPTSTTTTTTFSSTTTSTLYVLPSTTSTLLRPTTTSWLPTTTSTWYLTTTSTRYLTTTTTWFPSTTSTSSSTTTTVARPSTSTTTTSSSSSSSTSSTTTTTLPVGGLSTLLEFPQLAAGGGYRSFIYLSNPNSVVVQVVTNLHSPQGSPLTLYMNNLPSNFRTDNIPPYGSLNIRLEDNSVAVRTGWAQVFATKPLTGMMVYQYLENGIIISEATVFASPRMPRALLMAPVLGSSSDTGLALANPGETSLTITMRLLTGIGSQVGSVQVTLGPREQRSKFIFDDFVGISTIPEGMLELTAPQSFVAVGLVYQFQTLVSGNNVFTTVPITSLP